MIAFEESENGFVGGAIGGGSASGHWVVVDVAEVGGNEDVFMVKTGGNRVAAGEVSRRPFAPVNGGAKWGGVVEWDW